MPITTVPKCKAFREIEGSNQQHDAELDRLIVAVQGFLEKECRRKFDPATFTEYASGRVGQKSLLVANPPIVSITNLWDDPLRLYAAPIASGLYVIEDAEAGIVQLDGLSFLEGLRNIKITYVGGFTTMPADLEQAAIELVWACREKGASNLIGVRSRSIADGNVQFVNLDWGSANLAPIISKYTLRTGIA